MSPHVPNKAGIVCEVLACTGRTARGTRRQYVCCSSITRVDPRGHAVDVKAKLEEGVTWEITQTLPKPQREGSSDWELVKRCRMTFVLGGIESEKNIWPELARLIGQQFSTPSRVRFAVYFYET